MSLTKADAPRHVPRCDVALEDCGDGAHRRAGSSSHAYHLAVCLSEHRAQFRCEDSVARAAQMTVWSIAAVFEQLAPGQEVDVAASPGCGLTHALDQSIRRASFG